MKNKIQTIKQKGIKSVCNGTACDAQDFFEQIIKPQFSPEHKQAIKATHEALMEYINSENAVFVLRLYGSDSRKRYERLRRGFLTIYPDGHKMLFCDNTFAMPFAAMKLAGESYTVEQLLDYMNDTDTRCGLGHTSEERELSYYNWRNNKSSVNLNSHGWYLAHIVPVGKNFNGKSLSRIFSNPNRTEWDAKSKLRYADRNLTADELSVIKAHFLRFIHPLNSFVVPKRDLLVYNGKNIGEEAELITIVQNYIKQTFPDEYRELNDMMLAPDGIESDDKKISDIIWDATGKTIRYRKTKVKTAAKKHKTIQKTEPADIFDRDEHETLDRTLKSIGKAVFLKLYPIVRDNPEISVEQVRKLYPEYAQYSPTSQKTRLSSTKSIIYQDLGQEALQNIISSLHMSDRNREIAKRHLDNTL